jgi:peptidoglycan/xylan/chitin deacetylase (PgdA/CDA1 family)
MKMTRRTFLRLAGAAALFPSAIPRTLSAQKATMPGPSIPALLYHDVANGIHGDYTLSPSSFSAQMEWLYANDYKTLLMNEIEGFFKDSTGQAVMLTFDDGYTSFMDYVFPLINEYRFKATVNIIGQAVDRHTLLNGRRPALSWDECRYLMESGLVALGCHSYALHAPGGVLAVSYRTFEKDLAQFQDRYKKELGTQCTVIAWPYGIYDEKCIEIARKTGFVYFLTSNEGYIGKGSVFSECPRLNISGKLDLISFQQYIGAIL